MFIWAKLISGLKFKQEHQQRSVAKVVYLWSGWPKDIKRVVTELADELFLFVCLFWLDQRGQPLEQVLEQVNKKMMGMMGK